MPTPRRIGLLALVVLVAGAGCGGEPEAGEGLPKSNDVSAVSPAALGTLPDLIVTAVNGPTTARPYGAPPIVLVTVCNQGTASGSTMAEIYFSSDSAITISDFRSTSVSIPALNTSQCHTASAPAWSPGEGSWYLGAIVDPQNSSPEQREDNNALAGHVIVTREWPNLAVTSVKTAESVLPGNSFTTDVSICNRGFLDSPPTYLELRVSTDSVLTNSDPMVGVTQVGRLMGGQCTTVRTQFTSPPPGSWFVGALVDPGNGVQELSEDDNAALGGVLAVGNGLNLSVASESVQAPSNVTSGASFTTSQKVCNTGTAYTGGSTLELRLSADTTITSADTLVGATPVPGLAAGECTNVSLNASASVAAGTWYLASRVDPGASLSELREDDNTSIPVLLGVGSGSDLQVSAVSGPASVAPHASFSTTATVCNRGTASAAASQVAVRLTSQGYGTQDSFVVGTAPVNALGAGQCQSITVPATAPALFFDYSPVAFTLSAVADSAGVVTELVESNNVTSGARLVIGMRPDFVITAVNGPTTARPYGAPPIVLVTVCNQGTTSGSPTPEIYFSSDSSLTFDDFRSAPVSMPTLNPGQCHTASAPAWSPGEGSWYLGANIMSPQDAELFFDNNALLGNPIVTREWPNLAVTSVKTAESVLPGNSFTTDVSVCNRGFLDSPPTYLELRVSTDSVLTNSDPMVGVTQVGRLMGGQCTNVRMQFTSPPPGSWFVGALVDPGNGVQEFSEDDNAALGGVLAVGNGLNFSVASESVQAPSNVTGGASFATSQKVCNTGTAYSGGSTLELRLSADTTITSADILVGATPVPGLAAGECTNVSLNASASVTAGVWYLASRVDPGSSLSELREDDNTSTPVLLGVGSGSDLQVSAVSGPASVAPHASFSATTTVCNRGTASAAASQVAVRLTLQSYGAQDSFVVGTAPVNALGAGQCQSITVPATAPSLFFDYSPVVFTLSAVADSTGVVPELVESNNTTSGARLVIGMRPDFVITAVNGPTTARPYGSPPIVLVTVCNQGTTSGSPTPEIYFSSDSSLTFDDFRSAPVSMPTLNPGQCHTASAPAWSPGEGSWYLGANIMSPQDAELFFDNNALLGNPIVTREWPNLAVTSVKTAESVLPGNPFTTDVSVCNRGFLDSPPTYLELRVSTDSVLTTSDPMVGVTQVGRLMGGQCTTVRTQFTSPPPGSWFVGALVDPGNGVQELSEDDNSALGGILAVGNGLNLSVASESVQAPSNVTGGASFATSQKVCNTGTAYSGGSTLELRLSADTTITSADTLVGATPVPGLAAGECTNVSLNASASVAAGTWYLASRVDPGSSLSELREDDNTSIPVLLGVGSGSDLQVSAVSGPTSVAPHASFSATTTVCNRGTASAAASQVAVRLTLQSYGTQDSFVVGTAPVAALGAGQCQPITVPATAPSLFFDYSPVVFTLSAVADSTGVVPELVETNNATSGARLVIGMRPDFVITAVNGPTTARPYGSPPIVLVTVCNQGTTSGSPTPEIYFSSDSSLTFDDFRSAPVSMPTLNPGQCHTASAPAWSPGEGSWYLGANIMSPQDAELSFDNNALLGNPIVTREWPNLAVTSVKAAQSVLPGNPFTTDVSICNRGFLDSPPTYLELRVSTDSVLTNSDPMVGVTQVGRLMGGQCTTVRTQFTSPPPGSWFVGAMVDPGNGMQESSEEDNAALGGVLAVGNGLNLSVASESVQAPSNVTGGASFTTSMNVCNTGTAYSGGSTLELRLSADTTITSADTLVGATPVPGLAAGACANVSLNASSSVATGTWYLAARVDPGSSLSELREDDNTSIPVLLGVGSGSDLQVSAVSGPASVAPHASFSTTATVCNRGTTSAAASQVAVRLTLQGYGTQDSFVVGTAPVAALGAGQCQPITVPATAPSLFFDYSPVVFTLSALADSASVVTELVESNNAATSGARLVIGMRPDFVITAVSGPAQTSLHGPAPTVLVTVCNQGTTSGSPSPEIYFSSDSSLTFDDFRSAPVSMPTLNPGQCHTASAPALPPGEGTWYLGANIMSPQDAELFFDNNALLGNAIVVSW